MTYRKAAAQCEVSVPPNVQRFRRTAPALTALALLLAGATSNTAFAIDAASASSTNCPQPFRTTYAVEWRGMSAGTSTLELTRKNATEYTYRSSNTARGFFRIALPDTITQVSNFSIVNGTVMPATYVGDDGSSDTDRDVSLNFDWNEHRVTGTAEDQPVSQPIEPGVQDSLSVQIALMCALTNGVSPKSFRLIDKSEIKEYQYTREGEQSLTTSVGKLDTVIYKSQKTGSTRATRFWIAPSLGYLPVRAEQSKRDKREVLLQIRSVDRSPHAPDSALSADPRRASP